MKTSKIAVAAALAGLVSLASAAQPTVTSEAESASPPAVFHAGGRHDQKLHEATIRARAGGQRMQQTTVHAGGRHDERGHAAALRADARRASPDTTR